MEIGEHIRVLDGDGRLLLDAAKSSGPDAPVPTCPGWRVRDLLAHVHYVHCWATAYVANAVAEMVPELKESEVLAACPPDEVLMSRVESGHAALVRTLASAPDDLRCWTFLPAPSPLAMWARRQAHEAAIHRVDAELSAGLPPTAFEPGFAADGVDELLFGFLGRRRPPAEPEVVLGTMGLEASDRPEQWTVRLLADRVESTQGVTDCDLRVRAPTSDLYLLLWNRRGSFEPELTGDVAVLEKWRERSRINWS